MDISPVPDTDRASAYMDVKPDADTDRASAYMDVKPDSDASRASAYMDVKPDTVAPAVDKPISIGGYMDVSPIPDSLQQAAT